MGSDRPQTDGLSSRFRGPIVIAGGGTAGHVLPGLAVADALVRRGHEPDHVLFVGSQRGLEATLVPERGYQVLLLPGRGIVRRLARQNVGAIWGLIRAFVSMLWWVGRRRPAVVLTLGGYASVAASLAAVLWRVPIVVTEQNARAGAANRLIGRFARACAVPVDGTDLPAAVVTGNPVRPEIGRWSVTGESDAERVECRRRHRAEARSELGVAESETVVVAFAGSLGARRINEAVTAMAARWADRSGTRIHHVIGARDWESLSRPESDGDLRYEAVRYEDQMDRWLAASDVAVCRSGGTTVAELAAVGVPAVLVPLPIAPRDHQRANAQALVGAGAAVLLADADCDVDAVTTQVDALLARTESASLAASRLGRPDAADAVAALVERHARKVTS